MRLWCRGDANHGPRIFDDVLMMFLKIRICASQKKGETDMLEGDVSFLFISSGKQSVNSFSSTKPISAAMFGHLPVVANGTSPYHRVHGR